MPRPVSNFEPPAQEGMLPPALPPPPLVAQPEAPAPRAPDLQPSPMPRPQQPHAGLMVPESAACSVADAGRTVSHPTRAGTGDAASARPAASARREKPHPAPGPTRFSPAAQSAGRAICTPAGGPGAGQARARCARAGPGIACLSPTTPAPTVAQSSAAIRHPAVCRPSVGGSHCRRASPCAIGACGSRTGHPLP